MLWAVRLALGVVAPHARQLVVAPPAAERAPRARAVARLGVVHGVSVGAEQVGVRVEADAGFVIAPAADAGVGAGRGEVAWSAAVAALVAIGHSRAK